MYAPQLLPAISTHMYEYAFVRYEKYNPENNRYIEMNEITGYTRDINQRGTHRKYEAEGMWLYFDAFRAKLYATGDNNWSHPTNRYSK